MLGAPVPGHLSLHMVLRGGPPLPYIADGELKGLWPPSQSSTHVTQGEGGRGNNSTGTKLGFPVWGSLWTPGVPETLQWDPEIRTIFT